MTSVSVFGIFVGIFYVGSVFGIGILKYRDIGIGIRYFAIIYNFWCNTARDCNPGLEFSIPGFGIIEFPIPGSRDPVGIDVV